MSEFDNPVEIVYNTIDRSTTPSDFPRIFPIKK